MIENFRSRKVVRPGKFAVPGNIHTVQTETRWRRARVCCRKVPFYSCFGIEDFGETKVADFRIVVDVKQDVVAVGEQKVAMNNE